MKSVNTSLFSCDRHKPRPFSPLPSPPRTWNLTLSVMRFNTYHVYIYRSLGMLSSEWSTWSISFSCSFTFSSSLNSQALPRSNLVVILHRLTTKRSAMRVPSAHAAVFILLILLLPTVVVGRQIGWSRRDGWHHGERAPAIVGRAGNARAGLYDEEMWRKGKADTVQVAGSSLPDCSHACGSCSPCRRVMVSFVCASLQEAETCPMAYKCMCKSKSYPVP